MSRHIGWRIAALTLFVGLWAGCGDESVPTQAEPQFELVEEAPPEDVSRVATYRAGSPTSSVGTSVWIGPMGGTIRLLDFEVIVPPGAVATTTRFRIKLPADPKRLNRVLATFEPHNVPFARPVTLRLPYRGTSAEGLAPSVIWWNGSSWTRYSTTLLPDGRLETTTDHFSTFGTEDTEQRGIIPVGG